MTFDKEDARLTAYLLGELEGAEREEMRALLEENAEARAFGDSMEEVIEGLGAELALADDEVLGLDDLERARLVRAAAKPASRGKAFAAVGAIAAAAVVLLALPGDRDEEAQRKDVLAQSVTRSAAVVPAAKGDAQRKQPASSQQPPVRPKPVTTQTAQDSARRGPAMTATGGEARNAPVRHGNIDEKTRRLLESLGYSAGYDGFDGNETAGLVGRHSIEPAPIPENDFISVGEEPVSTFSIDVDTASYARVRASLRAGQRPLPESVRIEELLNYFAYDIPKPAKGEAFGVLGEVAQAPWKPENKLVRIGLRARDIVGERGDANLVFLVDVSGSMHAENKLPLLKESLSMLLPTLRPTDRIAIVAYAGASGVKLPSTEVRNAKAIRKALGSLRSGGGTNGSAGIEMAYEIAQEHFVPGGINRVILATDGDFNLGTTSKLGLTQLIEEKAKDNVFLTVLGFGDMRHSDARMEQLANHGNGVYAYLDTIEEAEKVLAEQAESTLVAVAKDVKLQIEFNPRKVARYRLIGYENRALANEDFANDAKDAGDAGAGHTVTALYEVVPAKGETKLRYQHSVPSQAAASDELLHLKLRYKEPEGSVSEKQEVPIVDADTTFRAASADFKFAASVAAFGMVLRRSAHKGDATIRSIEAWAEAGAVGDATGRRAGFLRLVRKARKLGYR